jgi:WD40 repeat protein
MARAAGAKAGSRLRRAWVADLPDHCVAVGWSADGERLAAAAVSGPVVVFDAKTGTPIHRLPGHGFGTAAIEWQPNGSLLATAGQDGKARLWDAAGAEVATLAGGSAWVEHLAWSLDGKILATAAGKKVRLWDAAGNQLREYADHGSTVADLVWRPGSFTLAVAAYGGVTVYDPAREGPVTKYEWKGSPLRLAWSPDGKVLAHGNQDATVHFWYADTGEPLQMTGYPTKVRELSWDYTARFLASGGGDIVCIWDCGGKGPEGTQPQMLEKHDKPLTAVAWQRRGFLVASAAADGRVCLWQPANKKAALVGEDRFPETEATALAWSPDDSTLAVGSASGGVAVYRIG